MEDKKPPKLFVSHPSTKADTAMHIEKALNARGVDCWIAPRDIEPGEQWDIAIRHAIADTDAMLLLFCIDSERSKQVKRELILADQSNKSIIPMRLERIEPHELSYHLADSQWIDWIEQRDEAIDRIAAKAREFQAGPPPAAPPPMPRAPVASHPQPPAGAHPQPHPQPVLAAHGAAPPYPPQPYAPRKSLKWLWFSLSGLVAAAAIAFGVWWFALRAPVTPVSEEWFAGVWADTRDCRDMVRFDRGGSLTLPDGSQGRWRIEAPNVLIMERAGDTERRVLTIISREEVSSPTGRAFRCV